MAESAKTYATLAELDALESWDSSSGASRCMSHAAFDRLVRTARAGVEDRERRARPTTEAERAEFARWWSTKDISKSEPDHVYMTALRTHERHLRAAVEAARNAGTLSSGQRPKDSTET